MSEPRQRIGLAVGSVLFLLLAFSPIPGIPEPVRQMLAVAVLMASWWVSEAIPLAATALLPLLLFPVLGLASAAQAAAPYANHLIFLFLGGFMLAQAMQRWNLHRRIALHIVKAVGTNPERLILGFMCATAFISMWVSNTATAAMMMPIGLAVIHQVAEAVRQKEPGIDVSPGRFHFGVALMLGIAYGASIGGVGTLIGTPPNVLLAGVLEDNYGIRISFLHWLAFGLPFVGLFLPMAWFWLTRVVYPLEITEIPGGRKLIEEQLRSLGSMGVGERRTAAVFALTAAAWIFRPLWTGWLSSGNLINRLHDRHRRRHRLVPSACRVGWPRSGLGLGLEATVGSTASLRRWVLACFRVREQRAVGMGRRTTHAPPGRPASPLRHRHRLASHHLDGICLQHRFRRHVPSHPGSGSGRDGVVAFDPLCARHGGGFVCLHDAGRHTAQRHRLWQRLLHDPTDGEGRSLHQRDRAGASYGADIPSRPPHLRRLNISFH